MGLGGVGDFVPAGEAAEGELALGVGFGGEFGVPALGDPFFEDGAAGADGPVFVPGGGFGFPMGAFPEAPEEEAAVGGVAEGGDEDVAGVVGGELLVFVRDDVELGDALARDDGGVAVGDGEEVLG